MARLDEQQRKVLDMLVQNGPMKSSSIADQLGVQKRRAIDILNDMTDKGVIHATCGGCAGRLGVHHYGCHLECHCDSCEPLIIPDISMRDIDGKTVIVAEILSGA